MGRMLEFFVGLMMVAVASLFIFAPSYLLLGIAPDSAFGLVPLSSIIAGFILLFFEGRSSEHSLGREGLRSNPDFHARRSYIFVVRFVFAPVLMLMGLATMTTFGEILPYLSLTSTPGLVIMSAIGGILMLISFKR